MFLGIDVEHDIIGLEGSDFTLITPPKTASGPEDLRRHNWDKFRNKLDNLIENHFRNDLHGLLKVKLMLIEGKTICRIDVNWRRQGPVYLSHIFKASVEKFYIRRSASSVALSISEANRYIKEVWS